MKKIIPMMIVIVIAGGAFYGGIIYGKGRSVTKGRGAGTFANLSPEERQARMEQFAGGGAGRMGGAGRTGGVTSGEVILKDDKSVTVKLSNGGSKIIFFSPTTEVVKSVKGLSEDLIVGEEIIVTGEANADGSLNAKSIQIRKKP